MPRRMYRWMDGWINGKIDGWMDGWMDQDGLDRRIEGSMDR